MTNSHVVSALRRKRAEISGHIYDLEKRIARQRASLSNLDATIKLFSSVPTPTPFRLSGLIAGPDILPTTNCPGLRKTPYGQRQGPLTSAEIAATVMQAKGMPPGDAAFKEIVADRALTVLRRLAKRGTVIKHGTSHDAK
jgi:hypothetical protein